MFPSPFAVSTSCYVMQPRPVSQTVLVCHDAHHDVALARLALAFRHRLTGQRAEPLHRHGLLGEPQDRVVGHSAVGDQVLCGGRQEDLHGVSAP